MTNFVSVPPAFEQLPLVRELNNRIHNESNSAITPREQQAETSIGSRRNKVTRQRKPRVTSAVAAPPLRSAEPLRQLFAG